MPDLQEVHVVPLNAAVAPAYASTLPSHILTINTKRNLHVGGTYIKTANQKGMRLSR